jgi:hypothetical protein
MPVNKCGVLQGGTVEGAVEWIMQHQDNDAIGELIAAIAIGKAQSYKCNECGRISSNMANLELNSNKTLVTLILKSLKESRALDGRRRGKKVNEIKALLKVEWAEREEAEKVDEVEGER